MERCILCGNKVERREIDYDLFFDKTQHLECNINIIVTGNVTYVRVRNSEGYDNFWHIDGAMEIEDTTSFTSKLEENISGALI